MKMRENGKRGKKNTRMSQSKENDTDIYPYIYIHRSTDTQTYINADAHAHIYIIYYSNQRLLFNNMFGSISSIN